MRAPLSTGLAVIAALVFFGCGDRSDGLPPVEAGSPGADILFEREGLPGPWWRRGGTLETFDAEHRLCLARSNEARANAEDPADAAYRSFLECMQQMSWVRGLPTKRPTGEGTSGEGASG